MRRVNQCIYTLQGFSNLALPIRCVAPSGLSLDCLAHLCYSEIGVSDLELEPEQRKRFFQSVAYRAKSRQGA